MELTQVDSPTTNASSSRESMSSDTHLLTVTAPLEQRISFPYCQHQQMGFPTGGELDQASSWSSRVWDHEGSIEAGGDLSVSVGRDWEVKTHLWDWENMVLLQGKGDEDGGLQQTEAMNVGSSKTGSLCHSSGIPGVAATGKGGHGKLWNSEQSRVAVDGREDITTGLNAHFCGKSEQYRSGAEQNPPHRNFSLGQDVDAAWDLQNIAAMHRIEASRRAVIEQQHNENLKISEQQFVGQQNLISRDSQKVMGFFGLGGSAAVKIKDAAKIEEKDACSNGGTGSGDGLIGLKLGKRTYFGDTAAVSAGKSAGAPIGVSPVLPSCSSSGRRRGTAASHIPRCQVEGCKIDLTTAKDYHKKHKVCELHSKAAKVIVASIEQRFCQQCSRFQLLSAFDEGKRSCRRRLAGHNERRRKPQPDPLALASGGASLLRGDFGRLPGIDFGDDHYHVHGLGDPHYLWQQRQPTVAPSHNNFSDSLGYLAGAYSRFGNFGSHGTSLESQLQFPGTMDRFLPGLSKPAADRFLMLLQQHSKPLASNLDDNRINQMQQGYGPMGSALSLSPSSGTRCLGPETSAQASHGLSGISDSGCALSLLSSQPWGTMTPSLSFDLSSRPPMLEQMLDENPAPLAHQIPHQTSGVRHDYGGITDEAVFIQPMSQRGDISGISPNAFQGTPQAPFAVPNDIIHTHTMLTIPHGHENRALHNSSSHRRPTIDLMELPSSHLHLSHPAHVQTANRDFLEFQSSKPFNSAMYDTQAML